MTTITTNQSLKVSDLDYHELNAFLNLYGADGKIQFDKDKEAARQYFIQHVNPNTFWFHNLKERLQYLVENDYYESELIEKYSFEFIEKLTEKAYAKKFRFESFLGANKFYMQYALKTNDGKQYLERFEDRVVMNALGHAQGDEKFAEKVLDEILSQRYQPATPTFLNMGKKQRGNYVSCFILNMSDNMESIANTITSSLQLSKLGGGVGILLSNVRAQGDPIKGIENAASGVVPVMKILEDSFSYANQLGARQGAGAVYLHAHHKDIMKFLDTKRENADEKIRIKTLSLGVVVPDITLELASKNEDMYLFSPYDVERVYGKPFSEVDVTAEYYRMVDNPNISKSKVSARKFFTTLAEIQFESGYPYIQFIDTSNRNHNISGKVQSSNICVEISQVTTPSTFKSDGTIDVPGRDISCNLGSLNIANVMDGGNLGSTINTAIRALTNISDMSNIEIVPTVKNGNNLSHAVGLGQMNLHGFLAREEIMYGSEESLDFASSYASAVLFHAITASNEIAKERNEKFFEFEESKYATGEAFDKYVNVSWLPKTDRIQALFEKFGIEIPTQEDWAKLKKNVQKTGMYNAYLLAIAPTGSISYVQSASSSIHPITSKVEIRKEGKLGRVYYPAPFMNNDNLEYFEDAYSIGYEKLIDMYSKFQEHTDQGLSLTLFFKDTATTRDINRAQIYAWKNNIKTIYYIRLRQKALEGTEVSMCVSCEI